MISRVTFDQLEIPIAQGCSGKMAFIVQQFPGENR